jgi:hypothetical protein
VRGGVELSVHRSWTCGGPTACRRRARACCAAVPNNAPVLQTPVVRTFTNQSVPWTYALPASTFVELDGEPLVFSAVMLNSSNTAQTLPFPSWLSFSPSTRCVLLSLLLSVLLSLLLALFSFAVLAAVAAVHAGVSSRWLHQYLRVPMPQHILRHAVVRRRRKLHHPRAGVRPAQRHGVRCLRHSGRR